MEPDSRLSISSRCGLALQLALVGAGSALGYAAVLARFPLLAIYARPIQNLTKLTGANGWAGLSLAAGVLALFIFYGFGALALAREARQETGDRRRKAGGKGRLYQVSSLASRVSLSHMALLAFPLLFLAILILVYPTTSVDLYDYIFRGRMLVRYGANTFTSVPIDYQSDPLFWYVAWRRAVTAYGPLWEGLSWLTARLAGEVPGAPGQGAARDAELLRLMLAYKGLAAVGFLLCGGAIWLALKRAAPRWRWLGLYLWLWNPLVLWESLAAGHNDAWMAASIVLAVGLLLPHDQRRMTNDDGSSQHRLSLFVGRWSLVVGPILAFLALTLGGLVKFLALMFGPVLLAAALRRLPDARARLRLVVLGGLACAAAVALAYLPFWEGWGTLRNFGDRGTLFTSSWLAVLQAPPTLAAVKALVPAPKLLALAFPDGLVQPIVVALGLGLLVFGVVWAAWRAWEAPEQVAEHALWLVLWFLFLCNPWFQPWYLLWALALLAIQPWRAAMLRAVVVFCCTAMLSYLAGVFLLPALGWNGEGAEWNALVSALIYGPPLLALLPRLTRSSLRPGPSRTPTVAAAQERPASGFD
jgi:hypothetical protein